jgi:hypothetical protein
MMHCIYHFSIHIYNWCNAVIRWLSWLDPALPEWKARFIVTQ